MNNKLTLVICAVAILFVVGVAITGQAGRISKFDLQKSSNTSALINSSAPATRSAPALSCTDSDGGKDIYSAGLAQGEMASGGIGIIIGEDKSACNYRFDDTLTNSKVYDCCNENQPNSLNEAYCNEEGKIVTMGVACEYGCSAGRCLTAGEAEVAQSGTCSRDSDGGLNRYSKGTCTDSSGAYVDSCRKDGANEYVVEYTCVLDHLCNSIPLACDGACVDGACVTAPKCVDSDGGHNREVKGNCTDDYGVHEEECTPERWAVGEQGMVEYSCDPTGTFCQKDTTGCIGYSESCSDGRCVSGFCEDSDGGINYNVWGEATTTFGWSNQDTCEGKYILEEVYCKNGMPVQQKYSCPFECLNGTCISNTDRLVQTRPREMAQVSEVKKEGAFSKVAGFVKNLFAREKKEPAPVPDEVKCVDSDGASGYATKGYARGKSPNGENTIYREDYCRLDIFKSYGLREMYCAETVVEELQVFCPNGCVDGKCVQGTCPESDADAEHPFGLDIYEKGTFYMLREDGSSYPAQEEFCDSADSDYLIEYICGISGAKEQEGPVWCEYGCRDGACIHPLAHTAQEA